ncbi:MAG: DUF2442 domain-containing protein [Gemmatimonadaceae bacterium]
MASRNNLANRTKQKEQQKEQQEEQQKERQPTAAEIDAQITPARRREARQRKAGLRAESARYDARTGRIVMELSNGHLFGFPARGVRWLANLTPEELAKVELSPGGDGLRWEAEDIDLSVPGLLMAALPRPQRARELARMAGQAQSPAKAAAARRNGAKGGRPRKAKASTA